MSLGFHILNDLFYPKLLPSKGEDYSQPLQLLAKAIGFIDPITKIDSLNPNKHLVFNKKF